MSLFRSDARRLAPAAAAIFGITIATVAPSGALADAAAPADASPPQASTTSTERGNILEEVVVTAARKRNEDAQTTPLAITAVSADMLETNHVTNFSQLGTLVPNLTLTTNSGSPGLVDVYLRGFGSNTDDPAEDPHVAIFVDGIYQPALIGTMFDMFDLAGIEVDAGPQGTLAGKNAPIGAIYITSAKPTGDFGGTIEADYGSYDHVGVRGKVNIPLLSDSAGNNVLAAKVSFSEKEGGNWVYNIATGKRDEGGEDTQTGRVAIAFTPGDRFRWDLIGWMTQDRSPQVGDEPADYLGGYSGTPRSVTQVAPYACLILGPSACPRLPYGTTDTPFTTPSKTDQMNISSTMSYRFDPATVTLVNGYVHLWLIQNALEGGTPYVQIGAYHDMTVLHQVSEEVRFASNKNGGWDAGGLLDWVVGGYFSNFDYSATENLGIGVEDGFQLPINDVNVAQAENGTTESKALFAHVIVNLTNQWNTTFGWRGSWDSKTHDFEAPDSVSLAYDRPTSWSNNSFEAGTAYKFDENRMAYFRFAQGYESGGFSGFTTGNVYQPETNNAYEVGVKTDWLEKRLRVNADVFRNNISNLQVESALPIPVPPGFLQEILNAGSAVTEGAEMQITAVPINAFTARLNVGYLDAFYKKNFSTTCSNTLAATDCIGVPFAYSPKFTVNLGGDYVHDLPNGLGSATLSVNWNFKTGAYTIDPPYPSSYQGSFGLLNAGLKLRDPSKKYSVEFYGTNILDRHYISYYTDPSGLSAWVNDGRPAEWGVRLTASF